MVTMCHDYGWYLINPHFGWGRATFGMGRPVAHLEGFGKELPSECSWLFPTWDAFERASK